eukprot:PITA_13325
MLAEGVCELMFKMAFKIVNQMDEHEDMLDMDKEVIDNNEKLENVDLYLLLWPTVEIHLKVAQYCVQAQDYDLDMSLDKELIMISKETLEKGIPSYMEMPIMNVNRAFGSASQILGAFLCSSVTLESLGHINDYFCKGFSGDKIVVYPPRRSQFDPKENIVNRNIERECKE